MNDIAKRLALCYVLEPVNRNPLRTGVRALQSNLPQEHKCILSKLAIRYDRYREHGIKKGVEEVLHEIQNLDLTRPYIRALKEILDVIKSIGPYGLDQ